MSAASRYKRIRMALWRAPHLCVGCAQPQGSPHAAGCVFALLTIGG